MADLYTVDVFGVINSVLDDVQGNIQPLGEMSEYSKTFSPNKSRYANTSLSTETHLNLLHVARDGVPSSVPSGVMDRILTVHRRMVVNFSANQSFSDQMQASYPEFFPTLGYDDSISFGRWLLPGYVTWEETINGKRVRVNLWLADSTLRATYPNYEIRVIPPVRDLADMQQNVAVLTEALDDYTTKMLLEDIRAATNDGEHPETSIESVDLRWVDQVTKAVVTTTWTMLVYGPKGLEYANQIAAIQDYLRDHTGEIPPFWVDLIPEIDNTTTMVIYPLWDKISVRQSGSVGYVMSPVIGLADFSATIARRGTEPTEFVLGRSFFSSSVYKAIGFIAHPEEVSTSPLTFPELYPSYAPIPSNTVEINMLPASSRDAVQRIEEALRIADNVDSSAAVLPDGYALEVEENLTFLVYKVADIVHRMATRKSYLGLEASA